MRPSPLFIGTAFGAAAVAGGVVALGGAKGVIGAAVLGLFLVAGVRRPFPTLLGLWFLGAVVPHGMSANVTLAYRVAGLPVHPLDVLLFLAVLVWALSMALGPRFSRPQDALCHLGDGGSRMREPFVLVAAVLLAATVLGLARGNAAWDVVRDLRSAGYWIMLPVAYAALTSWERIATALRALVAGSAVFALVAVALALVPDGAWMRADLLAYWEGLSRIYFHNHYLLVLATPLCFVRALVEPRARVRLFLLALVVLFAGAIALSLTRNIMAATAGTLLLAPFLVWAYRPELRPRLQWGSVGGLVVVALAAGGAVQVASRTLGDDAPPVGFTELERRFSTLATPHQLDSSFRGRVVSYGHALEDIAQAPVVGRGLGALARIDWALKSRRAVHAEGFQPSVDSVPLTVLLKTGVLGLLVVLWFAARLVGLQTWALMNAPAPRLLGWIPAVLLSATLALIVGSLLHTVLLNSRFVFVFAVVCAAADRLVSFAAERRYLPTDPESLASTSVGTTRLAQ